MNELAVLKELAIALQDNTEAQRLLLSKLNEPEVPPDQKSWTASQCAAYLNRSVSSFLQRIAPLPDFPRAKKLKTTLGETHREWKAKDVIEWNMKRFTD